MYVSAPNDLHKAPSSSPVMKKLFTFYYSTLIISGQMIDEHNSFILSLINCLCRNIAKFFGTVSMLYVLEIFVNSTATMRWNHGYQIIG